MKMLSYTKKIPEFDDEFEKNYSPFMVNRFFSLFRDSSVVVANMLNKNYGISKKDHFLFLHGMIRKGNRIHKGKWPKKAKDADIEMIMEEYNYSYKRAVEVSNLITKEQLTEMQTDRYKGGAF
jgi:hypothetical protein